MVLKKRREYFVTTTGNYYDNENPDNIREIPKSFCPRCLELGFYNYLKERLYPKSELVNNEKPSDWELWTQCHVCGTLVHVAEAKQENEITPLRDQENTGYSSKKLTVNHFVPSRRNDTNRKIKKPIRENPEIDDMDVKPKVERGSKLVSYTDSDR